MTVLDRGAGAALAAAALAVLAWASQAPMTAHDTPEAMLRLAWSARPERIEVCKEASEEELSRLPAHMRQRVVCEGAAAHYRLTVHVDGRLVAEQLVQAGGLRQDRRLFVLRELAVPAGGRTVAVRFDRVEADAPPAGATAREPVADRQKADTVPPHLALTERLAFPPRTVVLVTYDPSRRTLVAMRGAGVAGSGGP
jgi:hypothetical protein